MLERKSAEAERNPPPGDHIPSEVERTNDEDEHKSHRAERNSKVERNCPPGDHIPGKVERTYDEASASPPPGPSTIPRTSTPHRAECNDEDLIIYGIAGHLFHGKGWEREEVCIIKSV